MLTDQDYETILRGINDDFDNVISEAENKLNKVYTIIGDTYEGYVKYESELDNWYTEVYEDAEKLFKRTIDTEALNLYVL